MWSALAVAVTVAVSIHAPAGGATNLHHRGQIAYGSFNPRARRGRD